MMPAVAAKVATVALLLRVTPAGTANRLLPDARLTTTPLEGAADDKNTVHVALPLFDNEAELQLSALTVGTVEIWDDVTVTVLDEPVIATGPPAAVAPNTFVSEIVAVADAVSMILATVPFAIVVEFRPKTIHNSTPGAFTAHCTVLPA
jgi:hypothetical protein